MKYSLKNKEFSRKKHYIFNNHPQRSRSKTTSPKLNKQSSNPKDNIRTQFNLSVKSPNQDQTAIEKLNSLDSQGNSYNLKNNESELQMFQSFSRVEQVNMPLKQPFIPANQTLRVNAIRPADPIKFVLPSKTNSELRQKHKPEFSQPRSESFQVCQDDNSLRVNRFFAQSILARQSQSPMNKVLFEPVIRKSVSPQPKSLSPDPKIYQHHFNKVNPINLKIQPATRVIYHQPVQNQSFERKVNIFQIPRQTVTVQSQRIMHSNFIPVNHRNDTINKKNFQSDEIFELKKKVQEQNLQIQYLKNQKQILESNIQLKFSPQKVTYHIENDYSHPRTPQKHRIYPLNPTFNDQQIDKSKLLELAQILKHNQAKILFLEGKYQSFYSQIYHKFNQSLKKCQEFLIKMFSQKYSTFTEQLNAKMFIIDQKSTQVQALDHKINIFTNTFRSIQQNLRITKLKLHNVELMIENKYKKSEKFWNKDENSRVLLMENQSDISSIRIFNDNQLEQKDREELKKLQRNLNQKKSHSQRTQNRLEDPLQLDSFLDEKYSHLVYNPKKDILSSKAKQQLNQIEMNRKSENFKKKYKQKSNNSFIVSQIYDENEKKSQQNNKSTAQEIQQFSPFQANEMFRNQYKKNSQTNGNHLKFSETIPNNDFTLSNARRQSLNNRNQKNRANLSFDDASSKHYDFSHNSFQIQMDYKDTPRNLLEKQISFTSQNIFQKNLNKTNSQNEDISDTLQGEQERLINILKSKKYQFPIDCWLDQMGCLRKKNQTYIFDDQGSVIMTTPAAFKKLKQKKFLL